MSASNSSSLSSTPFYSISGFPSCPWYRRAVCIAQEFVNTRPDKEEDDVIIQTKEMSREHFSGYLNEMQQHIEGVAFHRSCPMVLQGTCSKPLDSSYSSSPLLSASTCTVNTLVGGYTDFAQLLRDRFGFESQTCGVNSTMGGKCS